MPPIPLSEFRDELLAGKVESLVVEGDDIFGRFRAAEPLFTSTGVIEPTKVILIDPEAKR